MVNRPIGIELEIVEDAIVGARVVCDDFAGTPPLVELVEAVLGDPRARDIERLGLAHVGRDLTGDLTAAVEVIAQRKPAALRQLLLGDHSNWHGFQQAGDVAALWPAIEGVTRLVLNGDYALGDVAAPAATRVELRSASFDEEATAAYAAASWPRVTSLEIASNGDTASSLAPLLERTDLRALVELSLRGDAFRKGLVAAVVALPMLPRLRVLALAGCGLRDDDAHAIAVQRAQFSHLEKLDLAENSLSGDAIAELRDAVANVVANDQRPRPPSRKGRSARKPARG